MRVQNSPLLFQNALLLATPLVHELSLIDLVLELTNGFMLCPGMKFGAYSFGLSVCLSVAKNLDHNF